MPDSFLLDARHCAFYLLGEWIFLYSRNLFWNTVTWKKFGPLRSCRTGSIWGSLLLTTEARALCVLHEGPRAWCCPVWLGERALRLALCAPRPLPPLIPSGASSAFECLPHVYVLISTRANTWVRPPADLSSSRSVQLVPLCDSNPKTLAVFVPLDSRFCLRNSRSPGGSAQAAPTCAAAWKLSEISKLGKSRAYFLCFRPLNGHCPSSSSSVLPTATSYILSILFVVSVGGGGGKSDPFLHLGQKAKSHHLS